MTLESCISADLFLHTPEPSRGTAAPPTIVFFIPGNPGLLGYYHEFLSLLSASLTDIGDSTRGQALSACTQPLQTKQILPGHFQEPNYLVAGFSLGGFELATSEAAKTVPEPIQAVQQPQAAPSGPVLSLRNQIELTCLRLQALGQRIHSESNTPHGTQKPPLKVILIGHSVGAYIALEVIRLLNQDRRNEGLSTAPCSIIGAILLTPTIVDIAKSDSGRILTPLLTHIPALPSLLQWATWGLVRLLPARMLRWTVSAVTGMTSSGLDTTLRWLKTAGGIKQTLAMAWDEMVEITEDSWGDEIWGILNDDDDYDDEVEVTVTTGSGGGTTRGGGVQLVLYFAKTDHWVSNATREAILRTRGRPTLDVGQDGHGVDTRRYPRVRVEVELEGHVVHGWPIQGSGFMAGKVIKWVGQLSK